MKRSGDRQHDGAVLQQPCERDLPCRGLMRLRDAIDNTTWLGQLAGRERKPRDEADVVGSKMRSGGAPQMPGPVSRMAPYPRRLIVVSPIVN